MPTRQTVREIQAHLEEMYGAEVSPTLISTVTDAVMDEAKAWQSRPLDTLYPIVYLDCIHVKSRDAGAVKVKAVYLALGIDLTGNKQLLGLWIAQTEGAKFWLQVVTELKNRGVQDIFIACVDGLKGFPEAIESIYPRTSQTVLGKLIPRSHQDRILRPIRIPQAFIRHRSFSVSHTDTFHQLVN
jgi:putative transposase